ncbi:MAG: conjugal transfer protein TraB [Deltaproteobacteria bacterium]|nr:conjugal transfer protein TraB [Deltaproteobacteria bacterium]
MGSIDEQILRATKEIVVKFIEAGRISPSGFHETFKNVYRTVEKTTRDSIKKSQAEIRAEQEQAEKPGG